MPQDQTPTRRNATAMPAAAQPLPSSQTDSTLLSPAEAHWRNALAYAAANAGADVSLIRDRPPANLSVRKGWDAP
jgi:hypothetical protein